MILKSWSILTDGAIISKPEHSISAVEFAVKFAIEFAWVAVGLWLGTQSIFHIRIMLDLIGVSADGMHGVL